MLGIAHSKLNSRIKDEQKAQRDYGRDISEAKKKKDTKSAETIGHIKLEEREHEHMLKKLKER